MKCDLGKLATAAVLLATMTAAGPAVSQKQGGILRAGHFDSPASVSMLEESTLAVNRPMMGVFNNLVIFDQQVAQNSPQSIVPDLATGWSWNEESTELTMSLRRGVKWHDGQPFTAKDVNAPGIGWPAQGTTSFASTRANPGTTMSRPSPPTAISRSPSA